MLSSKLFAINRWPTNHDRIDQRFFLLTLLAAVLLHLGGIYAWSLIPKIKVVDVPVHALSIKLSDGDEMTNTELKSIQSNATNNVNVESTVSHLVRDQDEEKARQQTVAASMDKAMSELDKTAATQTPAASSALVASPSPATTTTTSHSKAVVKGKFDVHSEGVKTAAPVLPVTAHQFVRDNQIQEMADNSAGASTNNSSSHDAELVSHYEQLISLWIQKFKIYPNEARSGGMQGETVVRIRIDRQGNIRYYALEHTTGFPLLDHAAIDMIRRANPVPAVPADYPRGDLMEFLIPVSFHLQP